MNDDSGVTRYLQEREARIALAFAALYVIIIADHPELAGPCNSEARSVGTICGQPAVVYIETKGYFSAEHRACARHLASGLAQASGYREAADNPRRTEFPVQ